jgi:hypothetical protein
MFLITAAFAFSLMGGIAPQLRVVATRVEPAHTEPTRSCAAPERTGTFRVTAMTRDSTNSKVGMILLENVEGCLEASMLTDENGPAIIDHIAVTGDMITGSIRMTSGLGRVSLRLTDTGISGSIIEGRHEWNVTGKRTN